jgi:hypothetical protein
MATTASEQLQQFALQHHIEGLTEPSIRAVMDLQPGYSVDKAKRFLTFQTRIDTELLRHPVITDNRYTRWFQHGDISHEQVKAFVVQFSVFSNLFLIAQLKKMINADTLEGMRASKEILANEIGVIFNATRKHQPGSTDYDREGDPDLVSTEGTVEGGTFRFRAAHFEWLLRMGDKLGLGFNDMGKRCHGTDTTLFFCDELARLYGNENYLISQAASYAVENWAAAGFWDELVEGFSEYNEASGARLPLAFFTWHARIEAQHAAHTQEELEELYFDRDIDEDAFIKYGNEMLDGVAAFWDGLDTQRQQLA